MGAAEARTIGLANLVVPVADLDATIADLVAALTAPPAGASRATAALIRSAVHNTPEQQDAAERAAQVRRLAELARG
jgi:enoyl-CoA hydratase/carnithine racemase